MSRILRTREMIRILRTEKTSRILRITEITAKNNRYIFERLAFARRFFPLGQILVYITNRKGELHV